MLFVTYGSETGNSEAIASQIRDEVKSKLKFKPEYMTLNSFLEKFQKMDDYFVLIVVCSTTGNGDSPVNSDKFMRFIRKTTNEKDLFGKCSFAVLGLGDSNYSKYQYIPKQAEQCLIGLGAKRIYKRGEADDAYGLEEVVEPWIKAIIPKIKDALNEINNIKKQAEAENLTELTKVETSLPLLPVSPHKINILEESKTNTPIHQSLFNAELVDREILSGTQATKEIIRVVLRPNESIEKLYTYKSGSSIRVLPRCNANTIDKFFKCIKVQETVDFEKDFKELAEKRPYLRSITKSLKSIAVEDLLAYLLDLNDIPRKEILKELIALFEKKDIEVSNNFSKFCMYYDELTSNQVSVAEVLEAAFKGREKIELTFHEIISNFPILFPRSYSLTSTSKSQSKDLEIVFSLVSSTIRRDFKNKEMKKYFPNKSVNFEGTCTSYLKKVERGVENIIICGIDENLEIPNNTPFLYICNGTGISPFISYIRDLHEIIKAQKHNSDQVADDIFCNSIALTGVRSACCDRDETILEEKIYSTLFEINSNFAKEKVKYFRSVSQDDSFEEEELGFWRGIRLNVKYVQDMILDYKDEIYDLIFEKKGSIILCGDLSKLYDECRENLAVVIEEKMKITKEDSLEVLEKLKKDNRVIIEKWD